MSNKSLSALIGAAVTVAMIGFSVVGNADPAADARKAIQGQYDKSNAAVAKKDLKGFIAIYSPDYVRTDAKGQTSNFKRIRQQTALKFSQTASVIGKSSLVSIKLTGVTAVVHVKDHRIFAYASPQSGNTQKITVDTISDDTWVQSAGVWLDTGSKIISETSSIDGKVVPNP